MDFPCLLILVDTVLEFAIKSSETTVTTVGVQVDAKRSGVYIWIGVYRCAEVREVIVTRQNLADNL